MQPVNATQPVAQNRLRNTQDGVTSVNYRAQTPNIHVNRNDGAAGFILTDHAVSRMHQRSISRDTVAAVLNYGRCFYARGATIYAIGHKEVAAYARHGIDLKDLAGYQVICSPDDTIITMYRNHDFHRIRKTGGRRSGYNRASSHRGRVAEA